jgi:hypothetical protein
MQASRFVIEDIKHAQGFGSFPDVETTFRELLAYADLPWNEAPNRALCEQWATCGRTFFVLEVVGRGTESQTLRHAHVLDVSVTGADWIAREPSELVWEQGAWYER